MNYGTRILAAGGAHPERVMPNAEFETFLDTSDEWIRTRTGIQTRRIGDPKKGENTLGLSIKAARNALAKTDVKPEDLDLIIVGTVTPDTVMPTTANSVQAELGAVNAFSFDLQAACSGFMYGLSIADQYVKSGKVKNALIIGAETLSSIVNWRDRGTCVLFGDAAGAVVVQRTESDHRIIDTSVHSDGRLGELLMIPHGYNRVPTWSAEYREDQHKVIMRGSEIFKHAVRNMSDAAVNILKKNDVSPEQVDFFLFHQANMRIIEYAAKTLNVPQEKMWNNLYKYGNTSAASLPICLDEATQAGKIKSGDLVLFATFGGGLTWASALVRI